MENIGEVEVKKWEEFHKNGKIWIDGQIAIIQEEDEIHHEMRDFEGVKACRVGIWTKFFDNGQIAWQIDNGDGKIGYKSNLKFKSYRFDGTEIKH